MRELFLTILFLSVALQCGAETSPSRVISLGPFVTKTIYALNAQDRLIADTVYCVYPKEANQKEKIGTIVDINLEKIVSLNPDLVIATPLTPQAIVDRLRGLGFRVETFKEVQDFEQLCQQFIKIGELLGVGLQAELIVSRAKTQLVAHNKTLPIKPKVFLQIGANPLFTVTKTSFLNDLIEYAGGINIAKNAAAGIYSREQVVAQKPEVIIIAAMGASVDNQIEAWKKYQGIPAIKNNRVYVIDDYKIGSITPLEFVSTVTEMRKMINGNEQ